MQLILSISLSCAKTIRISLILSSLWQLFACSWIRPFELIAIRFFASFFLELVVNITVQHKNIWVFIIGVPFIYIRETRHTISSAQSITKQQHFSVLIECTTTLRAFFSSNAGHISRSPSLPVVDLLLALQIAHLKRIVSDQRNTPSHHCVLPSQGFSFRFD